MAAPVVQGTPTTKAGSVSPTVIDKPTGLADGEVLFAILASGGGNTFGPPAGWATHLNHEALDSTYSLALFTKVVTNAAGEAATYSFTGGSSNRVGAMFRISGADTTTPVRAIGTVADAEGGGTNYTANAITGAVDDLLLYCAMVENATSWTPPSSPAMTEVVDASSGGSGASSSKSTLTVARQALTSAGDTGTRAGTPGTTSNWIAILLAIQPSATPLVDRVPRMSPLPQTLAH